MPDDEHIENSGRLSETAGWSDVADRAFAGSKSLSRGFDVARDERAYREKQEEQARKLRDREEQDHQQEKTRNDENLDFLIVVLDAINRRMDELRERMARNYEILRQKYGDDVIGGMAATFLSEEELEGVSTDEEKMRALSAKMLDEDGEIKGRYEGLRESDYVHDWNQMDTLSPLQAQAMLAKHGSPQERADAAAEIASSTFAQKRGLSLNTSDETAGTEMDANRSKTASNLTAGNAFGFE